MCLRAAGRLKVLMTDRTDVPNSAHHNCRPNRTAARYLRSRVRRFCLFTFGSEIHRQRPETS